MKNKQYHKHSVHQAAFAFLCIMGMTLGACSDNDLDDATNQGDRGTAVSYIVSNAQNGAHRSAASRALPGSPLSRAAFAEQIAPLSLTPEDLISQKLDVQGGDGNTCLIEITTAGIESMPRKAGTSTEAGTANRSRIAPRANIVETFSAADHFSSIGYRGTTSTLSTTPWFYNKDTNPDGTLVNEILWSWEQPYGKFYAVYPLVTSSYNKLQLSPDSYTSTPYVDFEVEPKVVNQKDLMTACSGEVKYATRYVAPTTNLNFHHALTAVRFKVGQNLSWNKTITKVEIVNAQSKGRYTLSSKADGTGAAWSNLSTPATFTLGGDGTLNVSTSQAVNQIIMGNNGDNFTFYMIPQSLAGVSVKIYFDNSTTPAITANLSGTWKPGTTKTYALSQKKSTWIYWLSVTNPPVVDYTATEAASYTVQSCRIDFNTHTQQPVKWKVVGYEESTDGGNTWTSLGTSKPAWLIQLSKEEGDGGTSGESGVATITTAIDNRLNKYNKVLQDATPKGAAGNYYNLSNATGAASVENTANSYLISAPGYYSIPLVYGNAITGGATNEHSYETTVSGSDVLKNFKDHAGKNITDPWITQSNGGANVPDGAKIVWTDQSGIVEASSLSLSADKKFVQFHVPQDKIKNGNAVIAVTKGGTVVWSWHLWFAQNDALNTIPVVNKAGVTYNFTKLPLGFAYMRWDASPFDQPRMARVKVEQTVANDGEKQFAYIDITQTPGEIKQMSSTFYQFGRKDAFPGKKAIIDGTFEPKGGQKMSIQNGIQHPEIFYEYVWFDNFWKVNLWSMDNTETGFHDNGVVKTVYDPCPAGFKMPASNAFSGFTTTGNNVESDKKELNVVGNYDQGWHFKTGNGSTTTIYFPALGWRHHDGYLNGNVNYGFYHSAISHDSKNTNCLFFNNWGVYPKYEKTGNGYGLSVRPVSE